MTRNNQHRFTRGKLCLINMKNFSDVVTRCVDEGETRDAIYSKIFTGVP